MYLNGVSHVIMLSYTMMTWVPHILVFIVPLQMVYLGDPTRRAADACESFGAMVKKVIKHTTCRRRRSAEAHDHVCTRSQARSGSRPFVVATSSRPSGG